MGICSKRLDGKKISILGGSVSGLSLARLACGLGASVLVSDIGKLPDLAHSELHLIGAKWEEGGHTDAVFDADMVVAGSGFPPHSEIVRRAQHRGVHIVGELDFVLPYTNAKIIGVTGSNGKTTTTSLIGHLLGEVGEKTATAGNIGNPIADFACKQLDYLVVELSSFQLHWTENFSADVAIVTNLAPDHIDWHSSYEAYVAAKAKIFKNLKPRGRAILQNRDVDSLEAQDLSKFTLSWSDEQMPGAIVLDEATSSAVLKDNGNLVRLFEFGETKLLGRHNMENVAMALTAIYSLGFDPATFKNALAGFVAPPHRCAYVAEIDGVTYVDDSKGTNVAASVTALTSLPGKKIVILGGKGKGEDYAPLVPALAQRASWAVLMGAEKDVIAACLQKNGYENFSLAPDMNEAVREASKRAACGETVLLSPACTSWDMYSDYKARGADFVRVVNQIASERRVKRERSDRE